MCFPGGYFGLGWLRDFWKLPDYVDEANDEPHMNAKKQILDVPTFSMVRFIGENMVGNSFGYLIWAFWISIDRFYEIHISPFGIVFTVPFAISLGNCHDV